MQPNYLHKVFSPEAFKGKVYGVTGGGHGIGEATVRALGSLGASLLVIDLDAENLGYVKRTLEEQNVPIEAVVGDVSDESVLRNSIECAVKRFGRLDGWVNNAMLSPRAKIDEMDEFAFVHSFEVNVLAAWRAARLCLPHFRKAGGGSIVNISSIMAHMTRPTVSAYTSSKSGLEGLTRALAVELGEDLIRVNTILPGVVGSYSGIPNDPARQNADHRRSMELEHQMGIHAQPLLIGADAVEVAGPILFYLSDAARFVTGTQILVDGGKAVSLPRGSRESSETAAINEEYALIRKRLRDAKAAK